MADKNKETGILNFPLDELMGDRFGRYAKYIIQERALPDVRDGLKPVQRRILFAMNEINLTFDKPYKKSARIVGDVIGKYHPHGDTSVYDALVRMSQSWKLNVPLVDMHGNNGSIDGDDAAAMRYTESRLAKISSLILQDIEKETVSFAPNFDDSEKEPTVLPGFFPNVLVNGATGIAAGYATNMPPHNLGEIIDALIMIIKNKNVSLDNVMEVVKGPDFPTGGIVMSMEGIKQAFETGKGRIFIQSKIHREENNIVIDEIPYEIVKQDLVKKIGEVADLNPQLGIKEVRDETDRVGLRIVIELNENADYDFVRKYLLKNTYLQISYNYNNVVIVEKQPKLLGIIDLLKAYLNHVSDVLMKKTKFDLNKSEKRLEIVEGLIKAVSILDEVIKIIRESSNRSDAINNLIKQFSFTENQSIAIVDLRLYRLTSTDIVKLQQEKNELNILIEKMKKIISDEKTFNQELINIFSTIKNDFSIERKSTIINEVESLDVELKKTIIEKNYSLWVSRDGYLKAIEDNILAKNANNFESFKRKPNDIWLSSFKVSTLDFLILISSAGTYYLIPIHKINSAKWNEIGMHVNHIATMSGTERIIAAYVVKDFNKALQEILVVTKKGLIKRTPIHMLETKMYSKAFRLIKLTNEDEIVSADLVTSKTKTVAMLTASGFSVRYDISEIPSLGQNAKGVKSTIVKDEDIVAGIPLSDEDVVIITNNSNLKKIKQNEIPLMSRPKRGIRLYPYNKKSSEKAITMFASKSNDILKVLTEDDVINEYNIKGFKTLKVEDVCTDLDIDNIQDVVIEKNIIIKNGDTPPKSTSSSDEDNNIQVNNKKQNVEAENTQELKINVDDILN